MILIAHSVHNAFRRKNKIFYQFYEFSLLVICLSKKALKKCFFSLLCPPNNHNVILDFIFYSDCVHRMERDLMYRTDRFGVEVRERVMWDIREGVVGSDTFIPKHVVIVTWKNMSFAGGIDNSLFRVSQMIPPPLSFMTKIFFTDEFFPNGFGDR
jgi:hypothetical protein